MFRDIYAREARKLDTESAIVTENNILRDIPASVKRTNLLLFRFLLFGYRFIDKINQSHSSRLLFFLEIHLLIKLTEDIPRSYYSSRRLIYWQI